MDKKELLAYLKAVCDGESAKYACEEVIQTLNSRMNELRYEEAPNKPSSVYVPPREPVGDPGGPAMGWGCSTALVTSFIVANMTTGALAMWIWGPVLGIIAAVCVFLYYGQMKRNRRELQRYEEAKAWERAQANYNDQLMAYRKRCDIVDAKRNTLKHIIAGYEAMKAEIEKKLTGLYAHDIIYERFRDMVAVHQMREYIEAGVCDELEGRDGAYALYYNDIRTARITDSISDLRRAVVEAINHLSHSISMSQRSILNEIQATNTNLNTLRGTINSSLDGINSRMDGLSHTLDMQRRELSESNEHARKIEHAVTASAYNDYIMKRLDYIDDYDRRHRLRDPRS